MQQVRGARDKQTVDLDPIVERECDSSAPWMIHLVLRRRVRTVGVDDPLPERDGLGMSRIGHDLP